MQNGFFAMLLGIAISTTRGMLMIKGAGTPLQFYQATILPLVDAAKMVSGNRPEKQKKSKKKR